MLMTIGGVCMVLHDKNHSLLLVCLFKLCLLICISWEMTQISKCHRINNVQVLLVVDDLNRCG